MAQSLTLEPDFQALLDYFKQTYHLDLTAYKAPTLIRQLDYRMEGLKITNYRDYLDYLTNHPEEISCFLNAIEVNFTSFFRDQSSWDYISSDLISQLLASKLTNEPIRIWSAGCASGRETYTLAIVFAEALGLEQFRQRVRIFGTDINENVLQHARQGKYQDSERMGIPDTLLEKYFDNQNNHYVFRKDLRGSITFHRHNLIKDAPFSQIDLLVCRNTLMYFNVEAQTKVLMRFHFSLKNNGFLFLGKSEMLLEHPELFKTVSVQHHIFTKVPGGHLNRYLLPKAFRR